MRITLILLACLLTAAPAHAAAPDADPPVTNRTVETIVRDGSTLYLGGDFSYVGRRTSLARLGADGRSTGTFPRVTDGAVEALLDDGTGGWYVGGSFATIGGADVPRLAHVLADGSVDPAFRPAPDGPVRALALAGGALYAGGTFEAPRRNLMLLDPADGSLLAAAPDPDGSVEALAANGGEVLVGGRFTTIAGQARQRVAALAGGTATAFDPGADGTVRAITVAGADIYLGGSFRTVGGASRKRLAAVDPAGAPTNWTPSADRSVHALAVDAFHVYAAGTFDRLNGSAEQGFGKLDRLTGNVQPVQVDLAGDAYALALAGGRLYVDGDDAIAGIDLGTGTIAWRSEYAGGAAYALAVSGGDVYAGGSFDSAGGEPRRHLAAIDLDTGAPTAWAPDPDAPVSALALHDGTLYAGGAFAQIAGAARGRLAAFDTATGALTAFDGHATVAVDDLVAGPAGVFAAFGTTLAALDPATGAARAGWAPAPNAPVTTLALENGRLYAGGSFTSIGGAARNRLAALDATTGQATAFDAKLSNGKRTTTVTALAASGEGTLFAGGEFESAGGEERYDLAELDGGTGAATSWSAGWFEPDDIHAIGVARHSVWIGGEDYGHALLSERDRDTGAWIGSLPHTHGVVRDLDTSHGALHAAGRFTDIGGDAHRNLASWTPRPALLGSPRALGAVAEGETLTCTPGTWEGEPTRFSYAWLRDGAEIAAGAQYVIAAADAGAELRCRVTARNRGGSETATSAPAGSPAPPASTDPPQITGTAAYEQTIACDPGTWSGSPALSYFWRRDGAPITGATAATYTLTDDDAGADLSCRVRAENTGGIATADTTAVALPDAPALLNRPTITGKAEVGEVLTCGPGTWSGTPTAYSYRWTRSGTEIGTAATYTVVDADEGRTLYCTVTARNAGGVTTAVVSAWIAGPMPVNTAPPSIAGTGVAGSRLTCRTGTWTDAQWVQRIRWLRDGVEVARSWSWTPSAASIGRAVRCEVTMSNGRTATALSAPLTITAAPPPTSLPAAPTAPAPAPAPQAPAAPTAPVLTKLSFVRTAVIRSGWVNVAYMACRGACRATVSIHRAKGRKKRLGRARVVGTGSVYVKLKRVRRRTRAVVAVKVGGRTTTRRIKLKPR